MACTDRKKKPIILVDDSDRRKEKEKKRHRARKKQGQRKQPNPTWEARADEVLRGTADMGAAGSRARPHEYVGSST